MKLPPRHMVLLAIVAFLWGACGGDDNGTDRDSGPGVEDDSGTGSKCDPATDGLCCDSDGTWKDCDYGCDSTTGDCWPQCDPTEDCCLADGYRCEIACRANGECYLPMTDCTGGKSYPDGGLCWQDPPGDDAMDWDTAESYCNDLGPGWRLPTISELRSLARGCPPIEWDMDDMSVPPKVCAVWDSCLSEDTCHAPELCSPAKCIDGTGPGAAGCFWDPALSGYCAPYWSVSTNEEDTLGEAWRVGFGAAYLSAAAKSVTYRIRCVK